MKLTNNAALEAVFCAQLEIVTTSREEIVLALKYFFDVETEESVHEIIGQESDPVDTIAAALDEYRKVDSCED